MFIPLYDSNHLRHIRLQYVTIALIAINVVVYLVTVVGGEQFSEATMLGLGYIPSVVHHTADLAPQFVVERHGVGAQCRVGEQTGLGIAPAGRQTGR